MGKTVHPEIVTGEKEYFFRRDRELIQEIRQSEKAKAEAKARAAHKGHCNRCGGDMHDWSAHGINGFACASCSEVAVDLEAFRAMVHGRHGVEVLETIDKALIALRSKSA